VNGGLVHRLRNVSVRQREQALQRDGFQIDRETRGGGRFYVHPDGRHTLIHHHRGRDRLARGTLGSVLAATRWTEEDARRLGLL
jgi:predicted RNA binding protein YcfA (HicA-like mRNA interferase family)